MVSLENSNKQFKKNEYLTFIQCLANILLKYFEVKFMTPDKLHEIDLFSNANVSRLLTVLPTAIL